MRGISAIIVTILLLMISVSLTSFAYIFFTQTFSSVAETGSETMEHMTTSMLANMKIDSISEDTDRVYIRNTGKTDLTQFYVYVNDVPDSGASGPSSVVAGDTGEIVLSVDIVPGDVIKVTTSEGAIAIKSVPGGSGSGGGAICGDGNCDPGEDCSWCSDCACGSGFNCVGGTCVPAASGCGLCEANRCQPACGGPCPFGEGDCDPGLGECQGSLTCGQDIGADFGCASNIDVCVECTSDSDCSGDTCCLDPEIGAGQCLSTEKYTCFTPSGSPSIGWGQTVSFSSRTAFTPTAVRCMAGMSPSLSGMYITAINANLSGSGTTAMAVYTGGSEWSTSGATRLAQVYGMPSVSGANSFALASEVPWPANTVTWICLKSNAGIYRNTTASFASDFFMSHGRHQDSQANGNNPSASFAFTLSTLNDAVNWYEFSLTYHQ